MYIPYVYFIKNKTTGMKYVGVRYAKGCHPDDLWTKYFTSSKLVKKLIDEFGKDDFYVKVIHKYPNDPRAAVLREAKYFPLIKKRGDYLNLTYSSGCQDLRVSSKAGKIGGSIVYSRKIGIFRDYDERRKWASEAGKASWESGNNKEFQYWASEEGRKTRSSMGGKNGNFSLACTMRKYGCSEEEAVEFLKKEQRQRGLKGGKGNKGFRWYNDGTKSFKYTPTQQKELSFDDFLKENPNYNKGRIL